MVLVDVATDVERVADVDLGVVEALLTPVVVISNYKHITVCLEEVFGVSL